MLTRSLHIAVLATLLLSSPSLAMTIGNGLSGSGQSALALDGVSLGSRAGRTTTNGSLLLIRMELDIGTDTYRAVGSVDTAGLPAVQANTMLGSLRLTSAGSAQVAHFFGDHSVSTAARRPNSLMKAVMGNRMDLSPSLRPTSTPIPEPGSVALYLAGLAVVGFAVRRVVSAQAAA